jgi:hypothetical protein
VKKPTRPLSDSFYCSITLELIRRPVIDPDGRIFEREAICNWIRVNSTSPVTRNALAVSQLRSNEALRDLIEDEKERTDESIHPSIRRWKMEDQTVETGIRPVPVDPPGEVPGRVDGSNDGTLRATAPGAVWDTGNNQNAIHATNPFDDEWDTGNNQNAIHATVPRGAVWGTGYNQNAIHATVPRGTVYGTRNNQNYPTPQSEWGTGFNQNYPTTQAEIDARGRQSGLPKVVAVSISLIIFLVSVPMIWGSH